jgi:hypothetical protein
MLRFVAVYSSVRVFEKFNLGNIYMNIFDQFVISFGDIF